MGRMGALLCRRAAVLLVLLGALGSAHEHSTRTDVVRNEGREAHRGDLSFVVTGGKPAVLDATSQVYAGLHAALLRDLDAALQADAQTMHERHELIVRCLPPRRPPLLARHARCR